MRLTFRRLRNKSTQLFLGKSASGLLLLFFVTAYHLYHTNENRNGPGEGGTAVIIPPELEEKNKSMFAENQFNLVASDMISVNRTLKDVRMSGCRKHDYTSLGILPRTSVIIVFYNEAWSTLIRSIHSIINRSPHELLEEIILVDDYSDKIFLRDKLEQYVATLPIPVYIVRHEKREGLIRARLNGAERARGEVLTFLDAHIECTIGWLEPLLFEIKKDRTNVICPIIDHISYQTFKYSPGSDLVYGGFDWNLKFRWYSVPKREFDRRGGDHSLPMHTPTMAGGLFSIKRDYFYEIGSYDDGMEIWGSENLEMSFRIWQCGGTLLIATCSHVGHVFRKQTPITFPSGVGHTIKRNKRRLADVWMDDYKKFLYIADPDIFNTVTAGDISSRIGLRKRLQCHSFQWYLDNIYPDAPIPRRYKLLGEIRNRGQNCLDTMGREKGENVGIYPCHGQGGLRGHQIFSYSNDKEIQVNDLCLDTMGKLGSSVQMIKCHHRKGNQLWEFNDQTFQLIHPSSNQCMMASAVPSEDEPRMTKCDTSDENQRWDLKNMTMTFMD